MPIMICWLAVGTMRALPTPIIDGSGPKGGGVRCRSSLCLLLLIAITKQHQLHKQHTTKSKISAIDVEAIVHT